MPDGTRLRPSTINSVPKTGTSSFSTDYIWQPGVSSDRHSLHTLSLNSRGLSSVAFGEGRPEEFIGNFHFDMMTNFSLEYFHLRGDIEVAYLFNPHRFISIGPAAGMYFASMGSKSLLFSGSDVLLEANESNDLYLRTNPTTGQEEFTGTDPIIFGFNAGLQLSLNIVRFLPIEIIGMMQIVEGGIGNTSRLNTTSNTSEDLSNIQSLKFILQKLDIRATFLPEELNIDFLPVILGYRVARYGTFGARDQGLYFGVLFL